MPVNLVSAVVNVYYIASWKQLRGVFCFCHILSIFPLDILLVLVFEVLDACNADPILIFQSLSCLSLQLGNGGQRVLYLDNPGDYEQTWHHCMGEWHSVFKLHKGRTTMFRYEICSLF